MSPLVHSGSELTDCGLRLVKNSYGLYWCYQMNLTDSGPDSVMCRGEKGYFRIVRGRNSCGIATDCIVVTSSNKEQP